MSDPRTGPPGIERLTSRSKVVARLILLALLTLFWLPIMVVARLLRLPLSRRIPGHWYRAACRILGWRVITHGVPSDAPRTFFVSNHISYADILALGSVVDVSYIAKAEVASWPVMGYLAKLAGTSFIERRSSHAATQRDELTTRLEAGDRLVLFPEGTSNDGMRVRPFKSALFSVTQIADSPTPVIVQPVSIAYTRLDGIPLRRMFRPYYAWFGDMTLVPHLVWLLGLGVVTIEITFHEPVPADRFESRKVMADYCHKVVSAGMSALNAGRADAPLPAPADTQILDSLQDGASVAKS